MFFVFFFKYVPRNITPRVMYPWLLFPYKCYIQSLSIFTRTFSFLALIVPEKSHTKISIMAKVKRPIKRHSSLWTLTPIPVYRRNIQSFFMFERTFRFLALIVPEKFEIMAKFENVTRDITTTVMGT